jgi:peptidoglycan hydrolase-like protein with peptidoglycan-binding domain
VHVYQDKTSELSDWIRDEVELERELTQGDGGQAVGRVQEWLNLHGFGLVVDQDYGPVTARQVGRFQDAAGLPVTGDVDTETFDALVGPMVEVLRQRLDRSTSLGDAVVEYARAHLAVHPRETGGENSGPWVRLYMQGHSGPAFLWCAGFVTFVLGQAAESLQVDQPVDGSFSCDSLAAQAREAGRFLAGADADPDSIPAGSIFLVRRTASDWTHTGIVTAADADGFDTIEGNTNDDGAREGTEVCARRRGWTAKDFIVID